MAIWRMRIACWMTKVTYTLKIRNSYFFFTTIMVVTTCVNATFICELLVLFNLLTPNVNYSGRTAPLTSKVAFYIFMQQI